MDNQWSFLLAFYGNRSSKESPSCIAIELAASDRYVTDGQIAALLDALPSSVRSAPSLLQFRRDLKTALHVSVIVLFTIVSSCVTDCNL